MDISKLNTIAPCDKGAEMEVLDPKTGLGTGAFITLAGVDSHVFQKATDDMEDRMARKGHLKTSPEDRRMMSVEILASCTLAWRGLEKDGEEWPCTRENAIALYSSSPPLRQQVDIFLSDRRNYLRD